MNTQDIITPSPEMKQHAKDLKEHASEGVKNVRQDASNLAQDAKDHVKRNVDNVKDEALSRASDAKDKAAELLAQAQTYVKENPVHVFAAGLLLGLFLARRRRA
jgi:ElaB/YqjD/DUF883 family membrane-anchored ribosome-binding protein